MNLRQAQIWKVAGGYVRIIRLERLTVDYKKMSALTDSEGTHQQATKKEFCRLLKGATVVGAKPKLESID